ncbi:MAG TPA: hypothetical protein VGF69_20095 [Thermoanaerobaculia bacterium]|jgi:hypothetical protein
MSNNQDTTLTPAVTTDPTVPLSPEEVLQSLRGIRQQIALPAAQLAKVSRKRRLAHVDAKFIEEAINAIGAFDGVRQAVGVTDEELRQEVDVTARWTAVASELRSLLDAILLATTARRQRIGLAALQTYKICQQLTRDENNAALVVHVKEMRRLNKFGRARRKPATPEEPAVTQSKAA